MAEVLFYINQNTSYFFYISLSILVMLRSQDGASATKYTVCKATPSGWLTAN